MKFFLCLALICFISLSNCSLFKKKKLIEKSDCSCQISGDRIPWQVSVYDHGTYRCEAVLINKYILLTAKNCVFGKKADELTVDFGLKQNSDQNLGGTGRKSIHSIKDIDTEKSIKDRVAVLKLKEPIEFIKGEIMPACLNFETKFSTGTLMMSGWNILNSEEANEEHAKFERITIPESYPQVQPYLMLPLYKHSFYPGDLVHQIHDNGKVSVEGLHDSPKEASRLFNHKRTIEQRLGKDYCTI